MVSIGGLAVENLKEGDENEEEEQGDDGEEVGDDGLLSLMHGKDDDDATDIFLNFPFCTFCFLC